MTWSCSFSQKSITIDRWQFENTDLLSQSLVSDYYQNQTYPNVAVVDPVIPPPPPTPPDDNEAKSETDLTAAQRAIEWRLTMLWGAEMPPEDTNRTQIDGNITLKLFNSEDTDLITGNTQLLYDQQRRHTKKNQYFDHDYINAYHQNYAKLVSLSLSLPLFSSLSLLLYTICRGSLTPTTPITLIFDGTASLRACLVMTLSNAKTRLIPDQSQAAPQN